MLEAAGSHLSKTIKVTIFLSSIDYYADANKAYAELFTSDPKPVSLCLMKGTLPSCAAETNECISTVEDLCQRGKTTPERRA